MFGYAGTTTYWTTECEGVEPMGRGRAKAKQTKVARDLKYRTLDTDFNDLERELHGESGDPIPDQYADLAKKLGGPAAS
ncbi:hypothetical protein GCM10009725_22530 [Aeromicrobium tamlense]